jgi:hypothetical protein
MTKDHLIISRRHFTLSDNYFQLVENCLIQNIKHKNVDIYFGEPRDDVREVYRDMTRWSDFRIFIPVLFNFFHAIELLLKAARYKIELPVKKPDHLLSSWYKKFIIDYPEALIMQNIFSKYLAPTKENCEILFKFYESNNLKDSDNFYEIFKYPTDKKFEVYLNFKDLRNLGELGTTFFNELITDIDTLRRESEKI